MKKVLVLVAITCCAFCQGNDCLDLEAISYGIDMFDPIKVDLRNLEATLEMQQEHVSLGGVIPKKNLEKLRTGMVKLLRKRSLEVYLIKSRVLEMLDGGMSRRAKALLKINNEIQAKSHEWAIQVASVTNYLKFQSLKVASKHEEWMSKRLMIDALNAEYRNDKHGESKV